MTCGSRQSLSCHSRNSGPKISRLTSVSTLPVSLGNQVCTYTESLSPRVCSLKEIPAVALPDSAGTLSDKSSFFLLPDSWEVAGLRVATKITETAMTESRQTFV